MEPYNSVFLWRKSTGESEKQGEKTEFDYLGV